MCMREYIYIAYCVWVRVTPATSNYDRYEQKRDRDIVGDLCMYVCVSTYAICLVTGKVKTSVNVSYTSTRLSRVMRASCLKPVSDWNDRKLRITD